MLILRAAKMLDLAWVLEDLIQDERAQLEEFTGDPYDAAGVAAYTWGLRGPRWALCDEYDRPLGVAGLERLRPGVYRSWFYSTERLWTYTDVTTVTKGVIDAMLADDAHRIETIALEDRHQSRRWYERLGLRLEATLQGFGATGRNAVLYTATRPTRVADVRKHE